MKRTLYLMYPQRPLEGGDLEQCKAEYEGIWANGLIPFVRQCALMFDTPGFMRISEHRAFLGLLRGRYNEGYRPGLETEWRQLWHLAVVGYRARLTSGCGSVILFKPEYQQKIPDKIFPHEWEGLDSLIN